MPTKCNRGFYCRSCCLLNMFRAPLCPSSGAQEYYTVVAACGISCCKNLKNNFVSFCVLSLKCRVLSRFVTMFVECRGGCVWVFLVGFFVVYSLVEQAIRSAIKKPLLHLVGFLFPHINDDARSKSHQIYNILILSLYTVSHGHFLKQSFSDICYFKRICETLRWYAKYFCPDI